MDRTILITRPEYDAATFYLSRWSEVIIDQAQKRNIRVIDLNGEKANKERVVGTLEKTSVKLAIFNGHGSEAAIYGQDDKAILEMSDTKAVKNKIIYARACRAAIILGHNSIAAGATSFLGYTSDFILFRTLSSERQPLKDEVARMFMEPSNYVSISLLKGHTTGEANKRSKDLFRKNIEKLIIAGPTAADFRTISGLLRNMNHQVCLGNREATMQ